MNLRLKINLFSLTIPAIITIIIIFSGLIVMNRVIYEQNSKLILKDLDIVISSIESDHNVLKKAGVDNFPHYINLAKSDFLMSISEGRFHIDGQLVILNTITNRIENRKGLLFQELDFFNRDNFPDIQGELQEIIGNEKFYLNYVRIPYWNWIVIIVNPSKELFHERYNYLKFVIPLSVIPLLLGFFLSYFALKNVFVRINNSLNTLNQVESGDLKVQIHIEDVKDEIQLIQKAINNMIISLRESYEDLEGKVESRTDELKKSNEKLLDEIQSGETARSEISYLNQYLKNIIDSMPSILIGINKNLEINKWNPEAEKISLLKEKDVLGSDFTSILIEKEEIDLKLVEKIRIGNSFTCHQVKIQIGSGSDFYADINYFPLKENRFELGILQIRDITERFKLEELMVQTDKMLTVGGLAAGMAHEINNPLAGMMQSAQNIRRRFEIDIPGNIKTAKELGLSINDLNSYIKKRNITDMIQSILDSGKQAAEIVENMIGFSNNDIIKKELHSIEKIMNQSLEMIFGDLNITNIQITRDYDNGIPDIPCEDVKIEQVFYNILRNAIQALNENETTSPEIKVRIKNHDNFVKIEIEDNGPGIDDIVKKRVFEPFFSTKDVDRGKGLGLSVSFFIIREHHNGALWLESIKGKGTIFTITLPKNIKGLK